MLASKCPCSTQIAAACTSVRSCAERRVIFVEDLVRASLPRHEPFLFHTDTRPWNACPTFFFSRRPGDGCERVAGLVDELFFVNLFHVGLVEFREIKIQLAGPLFERFAV